MGYIRKALEKGYLEHPRSACWTDDMSDIFVHFGRCLCCLLPLLSTGSCHVFIQIHATGCCFLGCTTKAFDAQKGSLWGCKVGAGCSA